MTTSPSATQRGPSDHVVRAQIIDAAKEHFSHYGYAKTTVSDLAKSIGFSKAYIYKFFESKQAVGEAICADCLKTMAAAVNAATSDCPTATEKFRRMFQAVVATGVELFFGDRKLFDIAVHAVDEKWSSVLEYEEGLKNILAQILREGRANGEFERKTPFDETCNAVYLVIYPFANPLLLQHSLDLLPEAPLALSNLVLRSLAP
jgi:AcrR family transcriptional regulator